MPVSVSVIMHNKRYSKGIFFRFKKDATCIVVACCGAYIVMHILQKKKYTCTILIYKALALFCLRINNTFGNLKKYLL